MSLIQRLITNYQSCCSFVNFLNGVLQPKQGSANLKLDFNDLDYAAFVLYEMYPIMTKYIVYVSV